MEPNYQQMVKVLKALSDPKRLQIVYMLRKEEMGASRILEAFRISQPTLSHDMRILVETGIVQERRSGKHVLYRLDEKIAQRFLAEMEDVVGQPSA